LDNDDSGIESLRVEEFVLDMEEIWLNRAQGGFHTFAVL
jgi:hypothetical protein